MSRAADRDPFVEQVERRFGWPRPAIGTASELGDHHGRLADRDIEGVHTRLCDFAPPVVDSRRRLLLEYHPPGHNPRAVAPPRAD